MDQLEQAWNMAMMLERVEQSKEESDTDLHAERQPKHRRGRIATRGAPRLVGV